MNIRPVELSDADAIAEIYNYYILSSHCTFEISPIESDEMRSRIAGLRKHDFPFLVGAVGNDVVGYAYTRQFRPRAAYRHSAEVSVYIKNGSEGQGIGTMLYT